MKKLLLSLASIVFMSFAVAAESYTIEFKANANSNNNGPAITAQTALTDVISNGSEYVASFTDFTQAYAACNYGLKIGANKNQGKITINLSDAGKVNASKIEVYASVSKNETAQKLDINGTTFDFATGDKNNNFKVCSIEPNAEISAITFEDKNTGKSTSTNQGFMFINKIVVTYTVNSSDPKPAGLAFSESAVTVTTDKVTDFVAPTLSNPNNLAVTYATSDDKIATVAADGKVTLTGTVGTAKITASFTGDTEFRAGEASYTITVKEAAITVATVAETVELATGTEFVIGYDLTVAYAKGRYVYAYTSTNEFILLYGDNQYKDGDVIEKGWTGKYKLYNNLPEVEPVGAFPAAASNTGEKFVPAEVAAADVTTAIVNHVVLLKNVVFETATQSATNVNFTGKVGETTFAFRNTFAIAAQEAGTYNVTVAVAVYNTTIQLYPLAYEPVSGGETPAPEVVTVNNVKETLEVEAKTAVKVNYALTVGFANAGNIFACDEDGDFIQVFANDRKNNFKVGDVIPAGWEATYDLYNGTPELLIASVDVLPEATEGTFTPAAVVPADITAALVNSVILVENVVFEAATPAAKANFTGKAGETELAFRNNYTLASEEAGKYNVTVVVSVYQGNVQLYPVNFEKAATDGIDEIGAEAAEPVYYNLQGVEVANPGAGIYIVRRGNKVTKEVVK